MAVAWINTFLERPQCEENVSNLLIVKTLEHFKQVCKTYYFLLKCKHESGNLILETKLFKYTTHFQHFKNMQHWKHKKNNNWRFQIDIDRHNRFQKSRKVQIWHMSWFDTANNSKWSIPN